MTQPTPPNTGPQRQVSLNTTHLLLDIDTAEALYGKILANKCHGLQTLPSGVYDGICEVSPEAMRTAVDELEHLLAIVESSELPPGFLATLRLRAAAWYLQLSRKDEAVRQFQQVDINLFTHEKLDPRSPHADRNGFVIDPPWTTLPRAKYADTRYHAYLRHWYNEIQEIITKGLDHSKRCCPKCGGLNVVSLNALLPQLPWYERWRISHFVLKDKEERITKEMAAQCSHDFHIRLFGPRFCRRICFSDEIKEMRTRVYFCNDCRDYFGRKPLGDHETWNGLSHYNAISPPNSSFLGKFLTLYPRPKGLAWGHCVSCCREIAQRVGDPVSRFTGYTSVKMICESCGYEQGWTRSSGDWLPLGSGRYYRKHECRGFGGFLRAELWNLTDKVKKLPVAALVFFTSKNVFKLGLITLLTVTLGTVAALSYYESLVMRPYRTLIAGLGSVSDLSRNVWQTTLPAYSATFWAGRSPEDRRADLEKFATRLFEDYPELTTLEVACIELPWRSREERDAAFKATPSAASNAKLYSPTWIETFTRDKLATRLAK